MTKVSNGNLIASSNIFSDLCYSNEFGVPPEEYRQKRGNRI